MLIFHLIEDWMPAPLETFKFLFFEKFWKPVWRGFFTSCWVSGAISIWTFSSGEICWLIFWGQFLPLNFSILSFQKSYCWIWLSWIDTLLFLSFLYCFPFFAVLLLLFVCFLLLSSYVLGESLKFIFQTFFWKKKISFRLLYCSFQGLFSVLQVFFSYILLFLFLQ